MTAIIIVSQEGDDAEAARIAVAQNLNVKILIDDNDVTIAGHPSEYLKGYDLTRTLSGHGLKVLTVQGEDYDALWAALTEIVNYNGPAALVSKRLMAPGVSFWRLWYQCDIEFEFKVADIEGKIHGHDAIPVKSAIKYLTARGYPESTAVDILNNIKPYAFPYPYIGSTKELAANRVVFGEAVNLVLDGLSKEEAARKVMVIDSAYIVHRNLS